MMASRFKMTRVGCWLAVLVLAALALPGLALADATPVQMILMYMPNVSNTGTRTASGIAELVMQEGEVRVTAAELPRLEDPEQYVIWVINTESNASQRIGAFNSEESTNAVHYENVLSEAIPKGHWNLLLVTIESDPAATRPSASHSIAGIFPSVDSQPLPGLLPNTGGEVPVAVVDESSAVGGSTWLVTAGLSALTLAVGATAGYSAGKRRASLAA